MLRKDIYEYAERCKIEKLLNPKSICCIGKEPGKKLRKLAEEYELVIVGKGDVNKFNEQPLVVLHLSDFFGMLKSVKLPKKRKLKNEKE